jgi:hypothetical protein
MNYVLKSSSSSQFPPNGGWGFIDPRTGMRFNGWEGDQFAIARKVIEHRRANPKVWPQDEVGDQNSVVQEIFKQKHATTPWLFRGEPDQNSGAYPSATQTQEQTILGEKCTCGSVEYEPVYCKTCSGKRIVGTKCKSCGRSK